MWNQEKVKFVRPTAEQGRDNFFNIFVLHQNRDYGRGRKNCIHESMIPEWMDVVVWGNEHECQPKFMESLVGTFRIYQPGSSIATSLCDGESMSNPKHMGLLDIKGKQFRLHTHKYTQVRPFKYSEISLKRDTDLQAVDPKIEEKMTKQLAQRVKELVKETLEEVGNETHAASEDLKYRIKDPSKVLIRLKIDHTGFPTLNMSRFGSSFVGEVANPSSILSFTKKKVEARPFTEADREKRERRLRGDGEDSDDNGDEDGDANNIDAVKIEELVKDSLDTGNKTLGLLLEGDMAQALEDYVMRKANSAINDTVEESLEKTQKDLTSKISDESEVGAVKIREVTAQIKREHEGKAAVNSLKTRANREVANVEVDDDDDSISRDARNEKSNRKKVATSSTIKATTTKRSTASAKSRKKKEVDSDGRHSVVCVIHSSLFQKILKSFSLHFVLLTHRLWC